MALVLTQEGSLALWKQILGISSIGNPKLHLFGAAWTPGHADTHATYAAIELAVAGYAPVLLSPPTNWTFSNLTSGYQASYPTVNWAFTAACSVYGYYVNDQTDAVTLWAESFAAAFVYPAGGGPFALTLQPWLASLPSAAGVPCP